MCLESLPRFPVLFHEASNPHPKESAHRSSRRSDPRNLSIALWGRVRSIGWLGREDCDPPHNPALPLAKGFSALLLHAATDLLAILVNAPVLKNMGLAEFEVDLLWERGRVGVENRRTPNETRGCAKVVDERDDSRPLLRVFNKVMLDWVGDRVGDCVQERFGVTEENGALVIGGPLGTDGVTETVEGASFLRVKVLAEVRVLSVRVSEDGVLVVAEG
ncbi:MAG: hypothetical protein AAF488_00260 [Planctomycetota bacterium]